MQVVLSARNYFILCVVMFTLGTGFGVAATIAVISYRMIQ